MPALYIMIPIALLIVALAIWLFFWAVDSGQYDDMDGPAHSILFDDEDPQHQAGVQEARGQVQDGSAQGDEQAPPHA
ncbi:MAG TPA: cbb3-type cytochrome oxidase assembly protein CcoS [Pseudomonas sp.]|nr:cbb3-type cytochrome oxidase assembly protein CcoS [Pseudomonas sp.]